MNAKLNAPSDASVTESELLISNRKIQNRNSIERQFFDLSKSPLNCFRRASKNVRIESTHSHSLSLARNVSKFKFKICSAIAPVIYYSTYSRCAYDGKHAKRTMLNIPCRRCHAKQHAMLSLHCKAIPPTANLSSRHLSLCHHESPSTLA